MTTRHCADVVIVGGGLAGLSLADKLHHQGRDYLLLESRSRLGGRILTENLNGASFDLGPAWFWSGQPRIADLASRFGLDSFEQYARGDFRFEDAQGRIQQGRGAGSMQGSFRLAGGMGALCDALGAEIDAARVHLDTKVESITRSQGKIMLRCKSGAEFCARSVVLTIPPRIASLLTFSPALHPDATRTLSEIPTWMAGQAKAVMLYDTAFWRVAGLSGDAMSHRGPLVEIHDACPASGPHAGLFGFLGVPPQHRRDQGALKRSVIDQLTRLFGPEAASPTTVFIKDWAFEASTATAADQMPLAAHPQYGLPPALSQLWKGHLLFGGTEVAATFGGYLEGALEASEAAFAALPLS